MLKESKLRSNKLPPFNLNFGRKIGLREKNYMASVRQIKVPWDIFFYRKIITKILSYLRFLSSPVSSYLNEKKKKSVRPTFMGMLSLVSLYMSRTVMLWSVNQKSSYVAKYK